MKTILYATDYSDNSIAALNFAYGLSNMFHADLILLHVFAINPTLVSPVSITYLRKQKEALKKHENKLTSFCEEHLGTKPDGKKLRVVVDENSLVWDGILEKREKFNAELIVVGMKGGSALREALLGSTTKDLIDSAPCPILAVPESMTVKDLKNIVYATAFEQADIFAIEQLIGIIKPLKADLWIVHISTKKEYAGEDQMEWFKEMLGQKVSYKRINFDLRFSEDIFTALRDYLTEVNADLVAMLEREGQGFLKSLAHRDLVKRMTSESVIPLLSFNKKNV